MNFRGSLWVNFLKTFVEFRRRRKIWIVYIVGDVQLLTFGGNDVTVARNIWKHLYSMYEVFKKIYEHKFEKAEWKWLFMIPILFNKLFQSDTFNIHFHASISLKQGYFGAEIMTTNDDDLKQNYLRLTTYLSWTSQVRVSIKSVIIDQIENQNYHLRSELSRGGFRCNSLSRRRQRAWPSGWANRRW